MRRRIFSWIAIAVFAGVIAMIWLFPARPRAGPWKLADGCELSLAGVTYGKKHAMRYGNGIADYLYPILSDKLRQKFGCKVATIAPSATNSLVVWLRTKDTSNMLSSLGPDYHLVVTDSDCEESEASQRPNAGVRWQSTNWLQGWKLDHFPHCAENICIRVYGGSLPKDAVAEFSIPNVAREKTREVSASTAPITIRTNGLQVSLLSLETGLTNDPRISWISMEHARNLTRARLEFRQEDKEAGEWEIRDVTARSAHGEFNRAFVADYRNAPKYLFPGTLWRDELAWKLDVELWRNTNFPPQETWEINGVVIPAAGQTAMINIKTNMFGSEIKLVDIQSVERQNKIYPVADLQVRYVHPEAGRHLRMANVCDEKGRKVKAVYEVPPESEENGNGYFILIVPPGAQRLDFTLAYTKSVFVEFMVKPTVAKAAVTK